MHFFKQFHRTGDVMIRHCVLANLLEKKEIFRPDVAIVLGSGSDELAYSVEAIVGKKVNFTDLGLPPTTNLAHPGVMIFCVIEDQKVVLQVGRYHYYESGDMNTVTATMRLYGDLGVKAVVLTNAVGIINEAIPPGGLMLVTDHIHMMPNPLVGPNKPWGDRFPDMSTVYDPELRQQMKDAAREASIELFEGVYGGVTGPTFETPAEIRMYKQWGFDTIGMSSTPEAIVARHENMRVVMVNVGANHAAGISQTPLSDEEVVKACRAASVRTVPLIRTFLHNLKL